MRSITVIILSALLVEAYAGGRQAEAARDGQVSRDEFIDKPIDGLFSKLVERAPKGWLAHHAALDGTTLGKPGHVASAQRIQPVVAAVPVHHAPASRMHTSMLPLPLGPVAIRARPPARGASLRPRAAVAEEDTPANAAFREWPLQYKSLVDRGLQCIPSDVAVKMVEEEGAVFVDLRPSKKFEEETIEGAINVPLFQPVTGGTMFDQMKRAVTGLAGVQGAERNPDFEKLAAEKLPRDKPLIIFCDRGGKLEMPDDKGRKGKGEEYGKFSTFTDSDRYTLSLKAAYELFEAGFTKLYYLKGGLVQWRLDPD